VHRETIDYVLDQRLALAYRGLHDPRLAGRTVSSIAHDAGFGDLSYSTGRSATGTASRRRVPASQLLAEVDRHPVRPS
jgi:AraC-like DNA-binding protein